MTSGNQNGTIPVFWVVLVCPPPSSRKVKMHIWNVHLFFIGGHNAPFPFDVEKAERRIMRERITCLEIPPSWFDILSLVSYRFPSLPSWSLMITRSHQWVRGHIETRVLANLLFHSLDIYFFLDLCDSSLSWESVGEKVSHGHSATSVTFIVWTVTTVTTITRRRIGEKRVRKRISYKCVSVRCNVENSSSPTTRVQCSFGIVRSGSLETPDAPVFSFIFPSTKSNWCVSSWSVYMINPCVCLMRTTRSNFPSISKGRNSCYRFCCQFMLEIKVRLPMITDVTYRN